MTHQFHREIEQAMDTVFSTFGENEPVQLFLENEESIDLRGVFSETTQEISNGGAILSSPAPNITLWEDDIPIKLNLGVRLKIRGELFSIKDSIKDGHGNILLELFRE